MIIIIGITVITIFIITMIISSRGSPVAIDHPWYIRIISSFAPFLMLQI